MEELHQIFAAFQSKVMEKEKTLREVSWLVFYGLKDCEGSVDRLQNIQNDSESECFESPFWLASELLIKS